MSSLQERLESLELLVTPNFSGVFVRNGSQWFKGVEVPVGGDEKIQLAFFGDYRKGSSEKWQSAPGEKADQAKINFAIAEAEENARVEREKFHKEIALVLEKEFYEFADRGRTPYLDRKQIPELLGARIAPNPHGDPILVVPLRDLDGKIWNYQRVYAQKLSKGDKFFGDGARIEGLFHDVRRNLSAQFLAIPNDSSTFVIAEGFATAASISLALGDPAIRVLAAFNAGNLGAVGSLVRAKFPGARIIFAADNDAYTVIDDKSVNVGLLKARKAAGQVKGEVVYPKFKRPQKSLTDFNDLACAEGLDIVKDQIENPRKYTGDKIEPMILHITKTGKVMPPTEKEVAEYLLAHFDGSIIKEEQDLFRYTGNHWEILDTNERDRLKNTINSVTGGELTSGEQDSHFRTFIRMLPSPPKKVSLWAPKPDAANFTNGTLHYVKPPGEAGELVFRPHAREDYLRNVLPFEYPQVAPETLASPEFDSMLERIWFLDPEKETIKRLIKQIMGACLIPDFHRIIVFTGPPASGKSTVVKLLQLLLSPDVYCSVAPHKMYGFHMEAMVGKLVNLITELPAGKPMNDDQLKMLIDGFAPIERKFKTTVQARVPALHVFAANKLPVSQDQGANAYGRRMIVVKTGSYQAPDDYQRDFEKWLIDRERQGIIARAIEGLRDLVAQGGHFVAPESSKAEVGEIHLNADIIGQFIADIDAGEVRDEKSHVLVRGPDREIEKAHLWTVFAKWQRDHAPDHRPIGKHQFNREIENRKTAAFVLMGPRGKVKGWRGLGHEVTSDSVL